MEYQDILGRDIRVVILPEGRDPDQVIRSNPEDWPALLASAQPLLDYKFEAVSSALDLSQPRQRSQAVDELLPLLAAIGDRIVQAHYLQRLARLAQVKEPALHQMLLRQGRKPRRDREPAVPAEPAAERPLRDKPEEHCLELVLRYPELRSEGLALSRDLLWQTENRELLELWQQAADPEELAQMIPSELEGHFQRLSGASLPFPAEVALERFRESIGTLKKREIRQAKELTGAALAAREEESGPTGGEELEMAAQALRLGSTPKDIASGEASQMAALLLKDTEIGIRLHRSSKMETDEEEDFAGNGPEVEVNG